MFCCYATDNVLSGIGVFVCTFFYMYAWSYTSEVNSKRIRERYLQAILRQEVEYFDDVGAGEVATRIEGDTRTYFRDFTLFFQISTSRFIDLVQQGISEKVPMCLQFTGSFIAGMILAYTQSWRLALAMSSILPCVMVAGGIMGKFMTRYSQCVPLSPQNSVKLMNLPPGCLQTG